MGNFFVALILISIVAVTLYFMWPLHVLLLVCFLSAVPFIWSMWGVARLAARFIKRLYPSVDQGRLEFSIAAGLSALLYPATALFVFLSL